MVIPHAEIMFPYIIYCGADDENDNICRGHTYRSIYYIDKCIYRARSGSLLSFGCWSRATGSSRVQTTIESDTTACRSGGTFLTQTRTHCSALFIVIFIRTRSVVCLVDSKECMLPAIRLSRAGKLLGKEFSHYP